MPFGRWWRGVLVATAVALLVTGCASTAKQAIRVGATSPESSTSESSTSVPETPIMPRLTVPVTLDNDLDLAPPLATDSSSLDAAKVQASFRGDLVGTFKTPPVVFLARYTDRGLVKARALMHTPASPGDPTDQLVVAIVGFGRTASSGGAEGHTGPEPTEPGTPDGQTILWTLDPDTGAALRGASFPGTPPAVSTNASG